MINTNGTPKSLEAAIVNGLEEAEENYHLDKVPIIRKHIVDFLAQKFGTSMMKHPDSCVALEELMIRIKKGI